MFRYHTVGVYGALELQNDPPIGIGFEGAGTVVDVSTLLISLSFLCANELLIFVGP